MKRTAARTCWTIGSALLCAFLVLPLFTSSCKPAVAASDPQVLQARLARQNRYEKYCDPQISDDLTAAIRSLSAEAAVIVEAEVIERRNDLVRDMLLPEIWGPEATIRVTFRRYALRVTRQLDGAPVETNIVLLQSPQAVGVEPDLEPGDRLLLFLNTYVTRDQPNAYVAVQARAGYFFINGGLLNPGCQHGGLAQLTNQPVDHIRELIG